MKTKRRTPDLRFSEFIGNWEHRQLAEVANIVGGGTPSTTSKEYWNGNIEWYSPAELDGSIYVSESKRKITSLGLEKSSATLLPVGTVLFTSRAGIGKTAILEKRSATNQGFQSIIPKFKKSDSYFLYSMTNTLKMKAEKLASGSTFLEISGKQMEKIKLLFPKEFKEQIEIGSFFKKIDSTITLNHRKLEQIKKIKRGMFQKMFPIKKDKYPRIRFSYYNDEWKNRRLKDLITKGGSGGTPRSTNPNYYNGDIPFLSITDISNSNGFIKETEKLITKEGLDDSSAWIVPSGSISLAMYASVGKLAILNIDAATSQAFYNMIFDSIYVRDFIYQRLLLANELGEWNRLVSTGTQANLNAAKVNSFEFLISGTEQELKEIGLLFKKFDRIIELQEREIELLEETKRGFLQKMFV